MSHTYSCQGIVLKRSNFSETDRIVTFYTLEYGKVTALAKGARKIKSTRLATLEPAAEAQLFFVKGKSFDLLTQTRLIDSHNEAHENLVRMTQTYQLLEIIDILTVETEPNPMVYQIFHETLLSLAHNGHRKTYLLSQIRLILQAMGFTHDKQFTELELQHYIEDLAQKHLKAKPFLTVAAPLA